MESEKILFIHIPKTGGTTIGNILHPNQKSLLPSNGLGKTYMDVLKGPQFHFGEHETFQYYKNIVESMDMDISSFFVFCFVRNPYSRLYSTWKFLRKQIQLNNPSFPSSFKYVIKNDFAQSIEAILNMNNVYSICQKQSYFVRKSQCNYIGRFENFSVDLMKILSIIHKESNNVPQLNQTSTRDEYKYHYTNKLKNIVYALFKQDFIEFNYER